MLLQRGASIMEVKFMLSMPPTLRGDIKREARKQGISMNEYIVTVLSQFLEIQRSSRNGKNTKGDRSE